MGKLWQLSQGHPKPAFSGKVQRGDQGKFLKNRPKSSPPLKGPKALLRKWRYSLICMHLNCKDWRRFWGKQEAPKVPEWPSYGNFGKVTQNPHFLKKCKRGDEEKFWSQPKSWIQDFGKLKYWNRLKSTIQDFGRVKSWNRQKSWIQDFSKLKSWIRLKSWLQVFGKLKS